MVSNGLKHLKYPNYKNTNKYKARKTQYDGIKFDSKAEAAYYYHLKQQGITDFKMQERFEIIPKFELSDRKYRARVYTPDFVFYDNDKIVKVVDVKGGNITLTADAKLRMLMFMLKYGVAVTIARYDYKSQMFAEKQMK